MVINRTFSLGEDTIKKIEEKASSFHLSCSAFLRLLIWSYNTDKKSNREQKDEEYGNAQ